jgi:hypothetical protein
LKGGLYGTLGAVDGVVVDIAPRGRSRGLLLRRPSSAFPCTQTDTPHLRQMMVDVHAQWTESVTDLLMSQFFFCVFLVLDLWSHPETEVPDGRPETGDRRPETRD